MVIIEGEMDVVKNNTAKVLVVEDNKINQKVVLGMLNKLGYSVDVVENGKEAVLAVLQHDYSLVLMDCQMPEMDGYEATRQIRQMAGLRQKTPVVALTANAMRGDREKCLDAGMDDYMAKPLKIDVLQQMLCEWCPRGRPCGDQAISVGG